MVVAGLFTMGRILFFCFSFIPLAMAVEELVLMRTPDSIKILSSDPVHSSSLATIFSSMFAYTAQNSDGWRSMAVVLPWQRPEAIAVLELRGFNNKVDMPIDGTKFLLENVGDIAEQRDLLSLLTEERFTNERPILLQMDLGGELYNCKVVQPPLLKSIAADPQKRLAEAYKNPEIRKLIEESTFNTSIPSETQLLTELATIKEFLKALKSNKAQVHDNIPDIYWLKVGGLVPIVDNYGTNSLQFQEAIRLIRLMISEFETEMRHIYDDNVVIAAMKVDDIPSSTFSFHNRKLLQETTATPGPDDYKLAPRWTAMFPVIFMMVAFVVIILFVAILGVSVAMWNMDPGKDSIIYRATQRMKKD